MEVRRGVHRRVQRCIEVYRGVWVHGGVHRSMQRCMETCRGLHECVWRGTWMGVWRCVEVHGGVQRGV